VPDPGCWGGKKAESLHVPRCDSLVAKGAWLDPPAKGEAAVRAPRPRGHDAGAADTDAGDRLPKKGRGSAGPTAGLGRAGLLRGGPLAGLYPGTTHPRIRTLGMAGGLNWRRC